MKKLIFSFCVLTFISCGSSTEQDKKIDSMFPNTNNPKNDSLKMQVDSGTEEVRDKRPKLSKDDSIKVADSVEAKKDPLRDFN